MHKTLEFKECLNKSILGLRRVHTVPGLRQLRLNQRFLKHTFHSEDRASTPMTAEHPGTIRLLKTLTARLIYPAVATLLLAALLPAIASDRKPPFGESLLMPDRPAAYVSAMRSGGPSKDGIPSIDTPQFWNAQQAQQYLDGDDIVFGVYHNSVAKAYPQRILVWHEIVNDTIGGDPLTITYCPLTGTALAFHRGDTEFGVSGRLINSNLVMYDRAVDNYWPQILATAIRGADAGKSLSEVRMIWTTWNRWQSRHPDTRVLSTRTGHARNYRNDPYGQYKPLGGYYLPESGRMFPVMHHNDRYPNKHVVLGFRTGSTAVAVDLAHLRKQGVIMAEHNGTYFVVIHDPGLDTGWVFRSDAPAAVDATTLEFTREGPQGDALLDMTPVNAFKAMWFAWAAYYPQTLVLDGVGS